MRSLLVAGLFLTTACSSEEVWTKQDGSKIIIDGDHIEISVPGQDDLGNDITTVLKGEVVNILRGTPPSRYYYVYVIRDTKGYISLMPRVELNEDHSYFYPQDAIDDMGKYKSLKEIRQSLRDLAASKIALERANQPWHKIVFEDLLPLEKSFLFTKK